MKVRSHWVLPVSPAAAASAMLASPGGIIFKSVAAKKRKSGAKEKGSSKRASARSAAAPSSTTASKDDDRNEDKDGSGSSDTNLSEMVEEIENYKMRALVSEETIVMLTEERDTCKALIELREKEFSEVEKNLRSDIDIKNAAMSDLNSTASELRAENDTLRVEVEKFRDEANAFKAEVDKLKAEISFLQKERKNSGASSSHSDSAQNNGKFGGGSSKCAKKSLLSSPLIEHMKEVQSSSALKSRDGRAGFRNLAGFKLEVPQRFDRVASGKDGNRTNYAKDKEKDKNAAVGNDKENCTHNGSSESRAVNMM